MLIQFNAEVWMGILNWLLKYRREMAEKFAQYGDRVFSEITQTWLHQWTRNATIRSLTINADNRDELALLNRIEIPRNVTTFSSIDINYLDSGVLQLLHKVQRFLSVVILIVPYYSQDQLVRSQAVLRHVLPLIDGIEALDLYGGYFAQSIAFFRDQFPTLFFEASILRIPHQGELQALPWLFIPKKDGQPKKLVLGYCRAENLAEILRQIRQHFLDPLVPPMIYLVRIRSGQLDVVQATTIENMQDEQLVMQKKENENLLLIARCPSNVGEEWLTQKFHELTDYRFYDQKRRIKICFPEIGLIDEATTSGGK